MNIYIMTDMEGVCGLVNFDDWCEPGGRYYERGKELLTLELNAAIEGFCAAGAKNITVVDGHGAGGINNLMLDKRAEYARVAGYPFALDNSFDCIAYVGQHAKAGTEYAHLCHTGSFIVLDYKINGVSVGEFGQIALGGATMGIPVIFAAGDRAFAKEAEALCPGVVTAASKRGVKPGSGDECTEEAYQARNQSAIHAHPDTARALIKDKAREALEKYKADKSSFKMPQISAPYRREICYRASGRRPAVKTYAEHPNDYFGMLTAQEIVV